jgi:DNA-directed RNA polymerase specialized sigma24 family protein
MAAGLAGEFEEQRAWLFGLAYRLLGSAADAEDVVQDTYVRWSGADQAALAGNEPEGRWARGPSVQSAKMCSAWA